MPFVCVVFPQWVLQHPGGPSIERVMALLDEVAPSAWPALDRRQVLKQLQVALLGRWKMLKLIEMVSLGYVGNKDEEFKFNFKMFRFEHIEISMLL